MDKIKNFFNFKVFFLPKILQVLFVPIMILSFIFLIIAFYKQPGLENVFILIAFFLLLILIIRAIFETLIVPFKQFEILEEINKHLKKNEKNN
jgi:hypothetical protein